MSFMDIIRKPFQEKKLKKSGMMTGSVDPETPGSAYKKAYEEEKRQYKEEKREAKKRRAEYRLERAAEKARRDVRNPLYKRLAQKAGAVTKEAISTGAAQIGREMGRRKAEKEVITKEKRKAQMSELTKIAVKKEIAKVKAKPPGFFGGQRPKLGEGMGDILGTQGPSKRNPILDLKPLGSSKQKSTSLLGGGDLLGLDKKKSRKKSDFFEGLL